ncbi:MAG TPA: cobalt-precorrin-6A reductase [Gordonia polyisoprenivorans]|uniref:Cobalt-precorrin-6A reductase n=1 Tax=Gordonia polyisoprenivorans TaxID=84595 RepID=A0A846WLD4_9ACTN|nr:MULTISPECIES: cobalt-precorrin-6A reductase [Gordonia]MBE7192999.1 cobalt-precorrin-6A reductase [Gordonia polyisoprenivorans]MDF3281912.1 cobalt-precorrin-6A reductase [Gordonia sp. N1V]NKY02408.1 cobalt-precorrin-6A reductase [Gordonia polyisoprenivorans]OPX15322.1 precorrin-6A reductase [Gordonia sp. i37]OZC30534.1 cobalt-precorrin-6A reductase [Gordonia polyisoprenivorans]
MGIGDNPMTGSRPPGRDCVLILGGTAEARDLAADLHHDGIEIVSSLAGRVARPRLPVGAVRIGGFGGVDGLSRWLQDNHVRAVVDATHPFAATITAHAVTACAVTDTPLLRLRREPWVARAGDHWTQVPDIGAAAVAVSGHDGRILLTTGRQDADAFAGVTGAWFLIRVVDPPTGRLPAHHAILRSRGPYHLDAERKLLQENRIDTLVTKNSGGALTRPKLDAAAELGVRVIMVERPAEPLGVTAVGDVVSAAAWVRTLTDG